ncbi:WAS/WASL-interacting protein family member 3-like [Nothobranchius furzeri]|uniref:WAS/WASL-interacting protein family member 3-like n=1 Tax=Nothobranchius furzeri TaxID=105023 RepID=UPI003904B92D
MRRRMVTIKKQLINKSKMTRSHLPLFFILSEQHPTAASISPPTPPPPPPPSPAQEQSDSDSETAERGPEQPAEQPTTDEENAPPPAPVQKKRLKKKKRGRFTPLQRLNRMKLGYLLLQVNSGLVDVMQQVLAL